MKCITKVDGTTIHNAEDLNLLMSIYKLLEYRFLRVILIQNVFLRFYSKDEAADFNANITDNDNFLTFKFNTKLTESTYANGIIQNVTIAVPRNYLSNFKQSLEIH